MKKTKILLVGALLFGVPSMALSLSTQHENATVVRAAEKKTMQFGTNADVTINKASITKTYDNKNWTFVTTGTTSFTQNAEYSQIGSSKKPAKSFTITSDNYGSNFILTNFYIKLGGNNGTTGTIKCSYEGNDIGSLSLNGANDVELNKDNLGILSTGASSGFEISVTNISKGFKLYSLSYSFMENNPDAKKYTVTYDATGGSCEKENDIYVEGNVGLTLPTAKKDGYKLSGWFDKNGNKVESPFAPTEDITLYAKWEESLLSTYTKVTSNISDWTGKYLIVFENGNVCLDGSLDNLDKSNNTKTISIKNNQIIGEYENYQFTFEKKNDGYSIKSSSNIYIGSTNNDKNELEEKTDNIYTNTISFKTSPIITGEGGSILKYNNTSGQKRFRFYSSGQSSIALYKLEEKPTIDSTILTTDYLYTNIIIGDANPSKAIRFIGSVNETKFADLQKVGFNFTLNNTTTKEYNTELSKLYHIIDDSDKAFDKESDEIYVKDGYLNYSLILNNIPDDFTGTITYYAFATINDVNYQTEAITINLVNGRTESK